MPRSSASSEMSKVMISLRKMNKRKARAMTKAVNGILLKTTMVLLRVKSSEVETRKSTQMNADLPIVLTH